MAINHKICISDEEVNWRITQERIAIMNMQDKGFPVRAIVAWSSPTSFETHALPILGTDTWQDVCTRYFDHFPLEARAVIKEIADEKAAQDKGGFSGDKTLLVMGRIPAGLRKFLDVWHHKGDFWGSPQYRKAFFRYFSKFKLAQPFSASIVIDTKRVKRDDGTYDVIKKEKIVEDKTIKPEKEKAIITPN